MTAFLMVYIVTRKKSPLFMVGSIIIFVSTELFIGGCAYALYSLVRSLPQKSILLSVFILLISLIGCQTYSLISLILKNRLSTLSLTAELWHNGECSELLLMIDSGNLVREQSTRKRVIFVKTEAIKNSIGDIDTLFEFEKRFVIPIDTPSGKCSVWGFKPNKMVFSDKKYNQEEFIVVPDRNGGKFGGYDGIAPLI